MITAEELLRKHSKEWSNIVKQFIKENLGTPDPKRILISANSAIELAKEFSKEANKADRINLLKHIHTKCLNMPENSCSECEYHIIDKESLLNAPNIELL